MRTLGFLIALIGLCTIGIPALAQDAGPGLGVTVTDAQSGSPIANARVVVRGPSSVNGSTNAAGLATIAVPPGIYDVTVDANGYLGATVTSFAVVAGTAQNVAVTLRRPSFSSLQQIGHVSSTRSGSFNTSSAAISTISSDTLVARGDVQVRNILDQIPGIVNGNAGGSNNAAPGATIQPQVRGGLPYETQTLIDGHPVALASTGSYNAAYLTSFVLDDVEVAKGPGVFADSIAGAINGTVNYRTLSPTRERKSAFDLGVDSYGGQLFNLRTTGTALGGRLGYAIDYGGSGSPGPLNNVPIGAPFLENFGAGVTVNGQEVNGATIATYLPGSPKVYASQSIASHLVLCCVPDSTGFFTRNELVKLSYNITPTTTLTVSDLSLQDRDAFYGSLESKLDYASFAPPAGYNASAIAGTNSPFGATPSLAGAFLPYTRTDLQNFAQAELRTSIGRTTILARTYGTQIRNDLLLSPNSTSAFFSEKAYGGVAFGTSTVPTIYNGTPVTVGLTDLQFEQYERDTARGETVDISQPIGNGVYTIAYDKTVDDAYENNISALVTFSGVIIPAGSSQAVETISARGNVDLTNRLNLTAGEYLTSYKDHYSADGAKTFVASQSHFSLPRAALSWRPNPNTAVRLSAGASLAPPYLALITAPALPPLPDNQAAPNYYTQTLASGNVLPETAFGFDVGADQRMAHGLTASADVYETTLRNQYLQSTFQNGTYQANFGAAGNKALPLYDLVTANLGNARYEGLELTLRRDIPRGVGFIAQGTLMRAFPYSIHPSLYATASGPVSANLGVIPNINYQATGNGYNAIGSSAIPYATGYGEINYHGAHGLFGRIGMTYYGNNNQFDVLPFEIVSSSVSYDVAKRVKLQLSADNIFNINSESWVTNFTGVPAILANGQYGATNKTPYGPPTARLTLHFDL